LTGDRFIKSNSDKGFSLLDLLIVIMIIGIIGMFVTPQLHSMVTESRLNEATGELVSGLQYARNLAVTHHRVFGVMADVGQNWFRVFDHQYKDDANPHHGEIPPVDGYGVILHPVDKAWYIKDFDTIRRYDGVKLQSVPAGGLIVFYPAGHSSSSDLIFVLALGDELRTVTVDGTTGQIRVD
jgi:prepilin-type N-terminal cleavage/methylation domain-containing protein